MSGALAFAAGAAAGWMQACALERGARVGAWGPGVVLLRISLAGAVLIAAALRGHIVAVAGGWAVAFLVSVWVFARRWA